MKKMLIAVVLCLASVSTAIGQDAILETADKLNKADRETALKMFPELEKKGLIGVATARELVDGKPREVSRFFFHLPISKNAKSFYYIYKLKTGDETARHLAAENLREKPEAIREVLKELSTEKDLKSFDLATAAMMKLMSRRSDLQWRSALGIQKLDVDDKLKILLLTSPGAWQDERFGATDEALSDLCFHVRICKPHRKASEQILEALKMRTEAESDPVLKSIFELSHAFVENETGPLVSALTDDKADLALKKISLMYMEGTNLWTENRIQALESLLGIADKLINDKELRGFLLSALENMATSFWGVPAENALDAAMTVHRNLGKDAAGFALRVLIKNYSPALTAMLQDKIDEQKDENKKKELQNLLDKLEEKHAERERLKNGLERVVDDALVFLLHHQSKEGFWDSDQFMLNCASNAEKLCDGRGAPDYDIPLTALSVLCYLGYGHTHRVGKYKKTVRSTLDWLKARQSKLGFFGELKDRHDMTRQTMAAMAICEAYAVTRDSKLLEAATKAIKFVLSQQQEDGGWKDGKRRGGSSAIVTTWAVLAMKAAKAARLDVPDESFRKVLAFFDTLDLELPESGEESERIEKLEEIAGVAIASIFCGRNRKHAGMRKLVEVLSKNPPAWDKGQGPVYWYFGTYAMFQFGGKNWSKWHEALLKVLSKHQEQEGCAAGSWQPVGPREKTLGRIGCTALNTLTAEIYYRYARAHWLDDDE